jgi:hypothetical protein
MGSRASLWNQLIPHVSGRQIARNKNTGITVSLRVRGASASIALVLTVIVIANGEYVLQVKLSPPRWRSQTLDDVSTYNVYRFLANDWQNLIVAYTKWLPGLIVPRLRSGIGL